MTGIIKNQKLFEELLYSQNSNIDVGYTEKSSGNRIAVKQIMANKKEIFIDKVPTATQKKIIIRDWTYSIGWSDEDEDGYTTQSIKFFEQLLDMGFQLFKCDNGNLQEITDAKKIYYSYYQRFIGIDYI